MAAKLASPTIPKAMSPKEREGHAFRDRVFEAK
jgi:hypothetical protein